MTSTSATYNGSAYTLPLTTSGGSGTGAVSYVVRRRNRHWLQRRGNNTDGDEFRHLSRDGHQGGRR